MHNPLFSYNDCTAWMEDPEPYFLIPSQKFTCQDCQRPWGVPRGCQTVLELTTAKENNIWRKIAIFNMVWTMHASILSGNELIHPRPFLHNVTFLLHFPPASLTIPPKLLLSLNMSVIGVWMSCETCFLDGCVLLLESWSYPLIHSSHFWAHGPTFLAGNWVVVGPHPDPHFEQNTDTPHCRWV